jgi:hypothetical protein
MMCEREGFPVDGLMAVQGIFFYADGIGAERCQQSPLIRKSLLARSMS